MLKRNTQNSPFRGAFTAIVTPFNEDGSVDYVSFEKLIEDQIAAKIDGLIVLGTTGESPTVSPKEHNKIIKFAIEKANARTKIIAGTGSNSTEEAIEYSSQAAKDGADALLLVAPYYNKPTQEGIFQHFTKIADEVNLPQIVYNIQGRCGVNIETATLARLAKHKNIVGVKEASGSIPQMMEVIQTMPADFVVLSGDDNLTYPLITLGGDGVISVLSNIMPKEVKNMVDAGLKGDFEAARNVHYELMPKMKACFLETNPIPAKTVLALQGKIKNEFRLPMCRASEETVGKLKEIFTV